MGLHGESAKGTKCRGPIDEADSWRGGLSWVALDPTEAREPEEVLADRAIS